VARQSWTLDALQRFSSYTNEAWAVGGNGQPGWQQAVKKVNHYDSDSDSPAWIAEDASLPDEVTRYVDGLDGNLAVQTGKTGARVLQLVDLHGDVMTTLPIRDGENTADWTALRHQAADEYGNPTDLTTGTVRATTGQAPGRNSRYGWLGGKQRSADALAGVLLMGVRLYDPGTGRFWSVDPEPGGNATAYDYCSADPVNCSDLDGRLGWLDKVVKTVKKAAKVVAPFAELASNIPGPIGAAAAGVSAIAYAVSGNKSKALQMVVGVALSAVGVAAIGTAIKVGRYARDVAVASKIVRQAARKTGMSGIDGIEATARQARIAGRMWVGRGARVSTSRPGTLISRDGLRQYRPPSFKPKVGRSQANFESRLAPKGRWTNNAHLNMRRTG
jgi:RHS repeat-associated protein